MSCLQETSQPLSCKNEDFKVSYEKPAAKQPAFQIHVDEPDGACAKKQPVAGAVKVKSIAKESPLKINNAVAQLRQPLATIDLPSAMDVSFGRFTLMLIMSTESMKVFLHLFGAKCCVSFPRLSHGHVGG